MENERIVFQPNRVAPTAFIAPTAVVIGDVEIGEESSIWFHAVIRADTDRISIGARTNIQDLAVIHTDPGIVCTLGRNVTVGHSAIIHGAVIEDDVLIGMRAVVMNRARIGRGSIVAVGAVVKEDTVIPPESLVVGVPAKIVRAAGERDWNLIQHAADHYVKASRHYLSVYPPGPPPEIPRIKD